MKRMFNQIPGSRTHFWELSLVLLLSLNASAIVRAQSSGVAISDNPSAVADPSTVLDVSVTASAKKGVLIPRMTESERDAIASPATGLLVFQTNGTAGFYFYNGVSWLRLATGSELGGDFLPLSGGTLTGEVTSTGDPAISMGKGNFGSANSNAGVQAFVAGSNNRAWGEYSVIAGGGGAIADSNSASGSHAVVSGGKKNQAAEAGTTVGGGQLNSAVADWATVSGGSENSASGDFSSVGGGFGNTASGAGAAVGGGETNNAIGIAATIPCGSNNLALGTNSFAAGSRAQSNHNGSFVWSDNQGTDFASTSENEFSVRALQGVRVVTSAGMAVNSNGSAVNSSAIVDIGSTAKGMLIPRMTQTERDAIASPAVGLVLFQTDNTSGFYYYDGTSWTSLASTKQDDWTAPTFQNGWIDYSGATDYSDAGYFRDKNGIVHLRGLVEGGGNQTTIFTLPTGYRPEKRGVFMAPTNGDIVLVDVLANGEVKLLMNHSSWVSLEGLTFRAVGF